MINSYPWYIADWRDSETTLKLNLAERGLYRELLDYCYLEGSLPSDERQIKLISRTDGHDFARAWKSVRPLFDLVSKPDGNRFEHAKVNEVRAKLFMYHEQKKESGIKSGRARREKKLNGCSNFVQAHVEPSPTPAPTPAPAPCVREEQCTVVEESEFVAPKTARAQKPLAADLNGHTSQRFEEWWGIWKTTRGTEHRDRAARAWVSVVSTEVEAACFECTSSYLASARVRDGGGYSPDNFLFAMAKDNFEPRWPAFKAQAAPEKKSVYERAKANWEAREAQKRA